MRRELIPKTASATKSTEEVQERSQKDVLRQSCIGGLRKLCDKGVISPRQKRVLLTDIIYCSANGEFSMVEVAFETLCTEGEDDKEIAEEEFAEQCRVFAASLSKPSDESDTANSSRQYNNGGNGRPELF